MRIGVEVPISASDGPGRMTSWPDILGFARDAEAQGLDSLWVCDHLLSGGAGRRLEGIHEAWTVLAALAASTGRVELGQLVMCASFRHPALLAKMAVTADEVSNGRLTLGIGAGWYDPEYEAFGFPTDRRVDRFEEALRVIRPLLRGEPVTLTGRYHRLRDAVLLPPPSRAIPILVAGNGPRMLRLTARYADAWNTAWYVEPDDRLGRRIAELDAALAGEARDRASLRRTVGIEVAGPDAAGPDGDDGFRGSVDDLARLIDRYSALGIDDLIIGLNPRDRRSLDHLGRALRLR
jgi:probable F420-dependent oxidoreductase